MTNSIWIWISVASIIVPSVVTLIGAYWQVKTAREIANPSQKIPQEKTSPTGDTFLYWLRDTLIHMSQSRWYLPLFMILPNIWALHLSLRSTAPLTRRAVFDISLSVGGICYGYALNLINTQREVIIKQVEALGVLTEGFHKTVEFVGILSKDVKAIRPTSESFELLITQFKNLTKGLQDLQTNSKRSKRLRKGLDTTKGL